MDYSANRDISSQEYGSMKMHNEHPILKSKQVHISIRRKKPMGRVLGAKFPDIKIQVICSM
jgi:hypothetical protein